VSLINDHEFRTRTKELAPSTVALDVVQTDDRVGVCRKDALARRQASLQTTRTGRSDTDGVQVKPPLKLTEPLVDEMWRAQNGHSFNVAAIQQFSRDEPCLDRFANANVVRNQQTNWLELQRHQQWHQLVGARLYGDLPEGSERTGTAPKRQQKRVSQ
jgi:hypothetical protein